MRAKEKTQALLMRRIGASIGAIAKELSVSKASVSRWCRDITLSPAQRKRLNEHQRVRSIAALRRAAKIKKEEKLIEIRGIRESGRKKVGALSKRDLFIAGLALYWGEGGKKGKAGVEFTNSEPASIVFIIQWLKRMYDVSKRDLKFRITINVAHKYRIREVLAFWSKFAHVPLSQFSRTSFVKTKQRRSYGNFSAHYGTLRINVRKSTNLHRRILGSLEVLQKAN
ncbi:MAG: hypothetical protein Q8P88_02140 [Candidatus Jorgensenbacteria bacterium]|nr:hypothetical protein [Candidatus Jorgensenbacteria bacterium]